MSWRSKTAQQNWSHSANQLKMQKRTCSPSQEDFTSGCWSVYSVWCRQYKHEEYTYSSMELYKDAQYRQLQRPLHVQVVCLIRGIVRMSVSQKFNDRNQRNLRSASHERANRFSRMATQLVSHSYHSGAFWQPLNLRLQWQIRRETTEMRVSVWRTVRTAWKMTGAFSKSDLQTQW